MLLLLAIAPRHSLLALGTQLLCDIVDRFVGACRCCIWGHNFCISNNRGDDGLEYEWRILWRGAQQ